MYSSSYLFQAYQLNISIYFILFFFVNWFEHNFCLLYFHSFHFVLFFWYVWNNNIESIKPFISIWFITYIYYIQMGIVNKGYHTNISILAFVFLGRCHVKIVPGAKIVPAYVITTDYVRGCPLPGRFQLRSCCRRRNNIIPITDRAR